MKNRSGFTLVEVAVAVAIMLIIGAATTTVIVERIAQTEGQSDVVEQRLDDYEVSRGQVDGWLGTPIVSGTTGEETYPSTTEVTSLPTTEATTTAAPPPTEPPPTTTTVAPTETTEPLLLPAPNPNFDVTTSVSSTWESGGKVFVQYSFEIINITPGADEWNSLVIIVPSGTQVEGFWSGTFELDDTLLTLYPYDWAGKINNKSTIDVAIQLSADGQIEITDFVVT